MAGATAQEVEQLVTRAVEQTMAQNSFIRPPSASDFGIRSISFPGLSLVYIQLDDKVKDTKKQFSDINLKLNALNARLPQGAGPIQFNSDFGDTSALMLTVASPAVSEIEIAVRAATIRTSIDQLSDQHVKKAAQPRVSIIYAFPQSVNSDLVREIFEPLVGDVQSRGFIRDCHFFQGSGFIGADCSSDKNDAEIRQAADRAVQTKLHRSELHPDAWPALLIRDPNETESKLAAVAGDRYSYRELDDFTDLISRTVQGAAQVAKWIAKAFFPNKFILTTHSNGWRSTA